jgi:hypothetical protein
MHPMMRQGQGGRRRGRNGRKPHHHGGSHGGGRNNTFDSNGPGVRLRGTAHQIYEKYLALARDATSAGDRIIAENLFQHADHYYRIILANHGPIEPAYSGNPGQDGEAEFEAESTHAAAAPGEGQPDAPANFGAPPVQALSANGNGAEAGEPAAPGGPSAAPFQGAPQGTAYPGGEAPQGQGQAPYREDRGGQQGGQRHQRHNRFRRPYQNQDGEGQGEGRDNREFRDRDYRDNRDRDNRDRDNREGRDNREFRERDRDQGDRRDFRNRDFRDRDQGGERREFRDNRGPNRERDRDRPNRPAREDEGFEPPAFLRAERPATPAGEAGEPDPKRNRNED